MSEPRPRNPMSADYLSDRHRDDRTPWQMEADRQREARAAAPPVERCTVCGVPFAEHPDTDACAIKDEAPPSPDPVAGLREARDVLLRVMQDEGIVGRKRQRMEDAADGMVRAALASDKPGLDVERLAEALHDSSPEPPE